MSADESRKESKGGGSSGGKGGIGLRSVLVVLIVLLAVLAVFAVVFVRTEKFRSRAKAWVEKKTGIPVEIRATRIGWPPCLVMEGVSAAPGGDGVWRLDAEEVRIQPDGSRSIIIVSRCALVMERTGDGRWLPGSLEEMGELRDIGQVGGLTSKLRRRADLRINRGSILWKDSDGRRLAELDNFDFSIRPVEIENGKRIYVCALRVYGDFSKADGTKARDISSEWIVTEQNRCIELSWDEEALGRAAAGAVEAAPAGEPDDAGKKEARGFDGEKITE